MTGSNDGEVWRVLSPEELAAGGGGGDAGTPKGCLFGDRMYQDGAVRPARKGFQNRCKDGTWVEESILDPTDPWT